MKTIRSLIIVLIVTNLLAVSIAQTDTVQVLRTWIDVKIVQSEVNNLYYIQCVDTCDLWYQTADIADLYVGFGLACAAMNH